VLVVLPTSNLFVEVDNVKSAETETSFLKLVPVGWILIAPADLKSSLLAPVISESA
jgi:hypothetical protein